MISWHEKRRMIFGSDQRTKFVSRREKNRKDLKRNKTFLS